tara:strand:+ start:335 stop:1015 length:681 start_codon:yes stop_codon:yes gene_type:complete
MEKRLVKERNNYFKLHLTGQYGQDGTGRFKFQLPALTEAGFTGANIKDCLMKIRKIYIARLLDTSSESIFPNDPLYWLPVSVALGTESPLSYTTGFTFNTNVMSRNCFFLQSENNSTSAMNSRIEGGISRFGTIFVPQEKYNPLEPNAFSEGTSGGFTPSAQIVYEDFSDIEQSGTLCSIPFGTQMEFYITNDIGGGIPLRPVDRTGTTNDNAVVIRCEFEVALIN